MALTRDRKRINVKGGGTVWIRELDPTPSNTLLDIGYLASSIVLDEHTMVDSQDEHGDFIDTKSGARKATIEITLEQTGIDEINLLKNADGKCYEIYYPVTLQNTKVQEWVACLCKLKVGPGPLNFAAATKRQLKLMVTMLAPKAAFTRTVVAFNVVKNEPYVVVEGASATYDMANTEASAMAAAIY